MTKLSCFLVILGLYSLCTTTTLARPHRQGKQSGRDFLEFLIQQYSDFRSSADNLSAPRTQTPQAITPLQTTTLAASTTESITTEMAKTPNATTEVPTMPLGPCRSAGHTGCCARTGPTNCFIESESCFCDFQCHLEDNCCSDIRQICPNKPTTCVDAGLSNGCCNWASSLTCHVPFGGCHCDKFCFDSNDCCKDVKNTTCETEELLSEMKAKIARTSHRLLEEVYMIQEMDSYNKGK